MNSKVLHVVALIVMCSGTVLTQTGGGKVSMPDTTMIFGTIEQPAVSPLAPQLYNNSIGIDLLVSTSGFGLGTFYRHEYSDNLSGYINLSVSEVKDDDEKDFIDAYGRTFTPGKVNRFLMMPLFIGIQKRMFKDDIVDNFRPFIDGAIGPVMIYVFPNNDEYFNALGKGQPKYTAGGYIGIGAYFGSERSNVLGLNLRYYYIPYPNGIESLQHVYKDQFGGVSISLSFGTAW